MAKLYATDTVLYGGREYLRGDELSTSLEDSVASDLKERDLASPTKPKDEQHSGSDENLVDESQGSESQSDSGSRRKR